MKRIATLAFIIAFLAFAAQQHSSNLLTANSGGAPLGHTGSPFDGRACNACHAGPAPSFQSGWLVSNIPSEGYVPGETYTITATASRSGINRFGFQVAAKTSTGAQAGTLQSISGETNVQSGGRSITHSSFGTTASNNAKTWVFEWTAPNTGVGQVTFFGSFLAANNNGSSSGDVTLTSNLVTQQRVSTNMPEPIKTNDLIVKVFPNPAKGNLNLEVNLKERSNLTVLLYDIRGREFATLHQGKANQGTQTLSIDLPGHVLPGVYSVLVKTEEDVFVQKLMVR